VILYAESSAVLCWLLGEGAAPLVRRELASAELVLTSELTAVECRRGLVRAVRAGGYAKLSPRIAPPALSRRMRSGTDQARITDPRARRCAVPSGAGHGARRDSPEFRSHRAPVSDRLPCCRSTTRCGGLRPHWASISCRNDRN
jgi:hypothetical protein